MVEPARRALGRPFLAFVACLSALVGSCSLAVDTSGLAGGGSDDAATPEEARIAEDASRSESGEAAGGDSSGGSSSGSSGGAGSSSSGIGGGSSSGSSGSGGSSGSVHDEAGPPDSGSPPDTGATPTTVDLRAVKDSYVQDGSSTNQNFGTDSTVMVKANNGSTLDKNAWVSFDISAFSTVTAAKLRLWVVGLDMASSVAVPTIVLHAPTASDDWSETEITWSNAPPSGTQVAMTTVVDANTATWIEIDVSSAVASDSDGVATFVLTSTPGTARGVSYASRENTTTSEAPVLSVTGSAR